MEQLALVMLSPVVQGLILVLLAERVRWPGRWWASFYVPPASSPELSEEERVFIAWAIK